MRIRCQSFFVMIVIVSSLDVFVSNSGDNNLNDGLDSSSPFKTIHKALNNYFVENILNITLSPDVYKGKGNINIPFPSSFNKTIIQVLSFKNINNKFFPIIFCFFF